MAFLVEEGRNALTQVACGGPCLSEVRVTPKKGPRGTTAAEGSKPSLAASEAASLLAAILARMAERMSFFSFRGFLEPLRPAGLEGNELHVLAPSAFARDWARDHYGVELGDVASQITGKRISVVLAHDPAIYDAPAKEDEEAPVDAAVAPVVPFVPRAVKREPFADRQAHGNRRPSRLSPKYTFESFVTGPSNRMAFAACTAVAEHPGARYTPLFLFGSTGLGKTHLLHAIGHEALVRHPHLRVAYLSAEQWVNEYIADIHERRFDEFRRRYREGCDLLLIDDIQFLAGKNASQDEFFHTFNALYEAHKQIVVTSDRYPHEIAGLEDRLKTRLQWGLVADVQPPEIETRIAILEQKAHLLGCGLPLDVSEYLASHITTSIRELEGALVRLSAFASITREPITLAQAKEQLRPMLAMRGAEVTVGRVIDVVAAYYGLRAKDLTGPSRQRQVTRARQVAMYLVRHQLRRSLPEIGRAFGDRDHTTVLASVKKIDGLKEGDAGVQAVLSRLTASLFT